VIFRSLSVISIVAGSCGRFIAHSGRARRRNPDGHVHNMHAKQAYFLTQNKLQRRPVRARQEMTARKRRARKDEAGRRSIF
jgi:hypothetical protein